MAIPIYLLPLNPLSSCFPHLHYQRQHSRCFQTSYSLASIWFKYLGYARLTLPWSPGGGGGGAAPPSLQSMKIQQVKPIWYFGQESTRDRKKKSLNAPTHSLVPPRPPLPRSFSTLRLFFLPGQRSYFMISGKLCFLHPSIYQQEIKNFFLFCLVFLLYITRLFFWLCFENPFFLDQWPTMCVCIYWLTDWLTWSQGPGLGLQTPFECILSVADGLVSLINTS